MSNNKRFLFTFFLIFHANIFSQKVTLSITDNSAVFMEGRDSVMRYQIEPKSSWDGKYKRANYIHPLFSLEGIPITEDFPIDHLHHRGIFWAWHQLYINGRRIGDGWEIKDFEWNVISAREEQERNGEVTLKSQVLWESVLNVDKNGTRIPLVNETNWITVYPRMANFRVVDIKIQLQGLSEGMTIGGSEDEKGYGGFSARLQLSEIVVFKDSKGNVAPENIPVPGNDWINIISKTSEKHKPYGLAIIPSSDNPGYPNPWILRSKASMQNAVYPFPGAVPATLSNETPLVLKYRLVVHDGLIDKAALVELQQNYFNKSD